MVGRGETKKTAVEAAEAAARALAERAKAARELAAKLEVEAALASAAASAARSKSAAGAAKNEKGEKSRSDSSKEDSKFSWKFFEEPFDTHVCGDQKMDHLAIHWYVKNFIHPRLHNREEVLNAIELMFTQHDTGIFNMKKLEELAFRFAIKNPVEKGYIDADVDEEDVRALLSILLETDHIDHAFLFSEDPWDESFNGTESDWTDPIACAFENMHLIPNDNKRRKIDFSGDKDTPAFLSEGSDQSYSQIRRGDRISAVNIEGDCPFEFHKPRVFELLAKFDKLEILKLRGPRTFRLAETISTFPNLKHLEVLATEDDVYGEDFTFGSPDILKGKQNFSNLESLYMETDQVQEEDIATLLFDILPYCPKLQKVAFKQNELKSFQKIARRINDEENPIATNNLRILNLGRYRDREIERWYPLDPERDLDFDIIGPKEQTGLEEVALSFKRLHDIGGEVVDDRVMALMDINNIRCVLEDLRATRNNDSSVPSSLWPSIIARAAWKRQGGEVDTSPDCIFFMLRNSAALQNVIRRGSNQKYRIK